jgi:hypothetical protein
MFITNECQSEVIAFTFVVFKVKVEARAESMTSNRGRCAKPFPESSLPKRECR